MGLKPQAHASGPMTDFDEPHDHSETPLSETEKDVSLVEILSLAENSIGNLKHIIDSFDAKIYNEFREIAQQISSTRSEIAQLNASDIRQGRIPDAGRELAAVVESTEKATHRIMEAAETIMTADPSDAGTYYSTVNENILAIFEACSFQDITGQRISRVVETLEFIDKRVNRFALKMGATTQDAPQPGDTDYYIDKEEHDTAKRKHELILNGPQNEHEAITQHDIDDLLNNG